MDSLYAQPPKVHLALRPRSIPPRPANNGRVSQEPPGLRLALLRDPALSPNVLCQLAIAALFPPEIVARFQLVTAVHCLLAIVRAAHVPVSLCGRISRCVRNKVAPAGKVAPILLVLPGLVAPAVRKIVRTANALARCRPARALVRANPAGPVCFPLRRRTKCRRAPSRVSRSIPAVPRSASVPAPISARWKVSASSIQLGNVPVQAIAVP